MRRFFLLLFLASCTISPDTPIAQAPNPKKQKQKIALLEKKLEVAAKEQQKALTEVERLAAEVNEAKLALIRRQIDRFEEKHPAAPALFLEEREALYQMIQEGPSPAALEAQAELDRILRIITERSEEKKGLDSVPS
jgi:septal ring factor EnvC (AmiA/AmiB activator)